jgi:hypothetical protein
VPRANSKRLVIDASVARAAGMTEHPTSRACRQALQAILVVCHRIAVTQGLADEWKNHRSRYFVSWRASMTARKKVVWVEPRWEDELRAAIDEHDCSEASRREMRKDVHLISAALGSDRIVIPLDDSARGLFGTLANDEATLRDIAWINPARTQEGPVDWLQRGASREAKRCLGFEDDLD